ncbi:MAG: glycosyltransferase family 4 protein [Deltaproteobacteria bacterium]|nr:glycosyltransferase family 4 protein [Deltaproteobacteria bacterium]
MSKIKVCIFCSFYPVLSGGAEYRAYQLASFLDREKYDVFFLSVDPMRQGLEEIEGVRVYFFKPGKLLMRIFQDLYLSNFRYIGKVLSCERPDVVYQLMANCATGYLHYLSRSLSFAFIFACASDADLGRTEKIFSLHSILSIPVYLLKRWGIAHADILIAQTEFQKEQLHRQFKRNALVLKNPHPLPPLEESSEGLPVKKKILWVSNLKSLKQPWVFVELAERFRGVPGVEFIMIGRPGHERWQNELEAKIDLIPALSYLGELGQSEVNALLGEAYAVVNTSRYEGFSNVFIQAWLRGVPVLSLLVDPDALLSVQGLGFCSGDFESLCRDLADLIKNPQLRDSMGAKARRYARENHSLESIGAEFQKIIETCVRGAASV